MTRPFILGAAPRVDTAFLSMDDLHRAVDGDLANLVVAHAICTHLGRAPQVVRWTDPVERINQSGSLAILPVANALGCGELARQAELFRHAKTPVVAIGLDIQSSLRTKPHLLKEAERWAHGLVDRAASSWPNVGARSAQAAELLDRFGLADHVTVIGCPSFFISPTPVLGRQIAERLRTPRRIAVVAGDQRCRHLRHIEAALAQLVTETNGSYIGQSPLEMMTLTRGLASTLEDTSLRKWRDYIQPNMEIRSFVGWSDRYGNMFSDVPRWLEHYRRFDFVVGTRIHGVILGIQAGIPSMCIVPDAATLELCRTLEIPHVSAKDVVDGINRDDLVSRFYSDFNAGDFDRNRRAICRRYAQFLWSNGLAPVTWLDDIADYCQEGTRHSPSTALTS